LTVIADESIDIIDESGGAFRSGLFSNSGEGAGGEPTGDAGDIVIKAPRLIVNGGRILTRTLGDGNAGNITIEVNRLELLGGGQIFNGIGNAQEDDSVLGNPDGEGHGGTLQVTARESIVIAGRDSVGFSSGLFSSAQIGSGDAGHLFVSAPRIEMRAGGRIEASSIRQSQGRAGTLTIDEVEQLILMEGAQIASLSEGDGQGGDIVIRGDRIQLIDNATISSESFGTGDAGNIRIAAQAVDLRDNSAITTTVNQGEAGGGNILIGGTITDDGDITTGVERLTLEGSRITANTDAGDGANIAIGVQQAVLDSSSEIAANTNAGIGGNVTIAGTVAADGQALTRAEVIVLRDSRITANAQEGKGGRIDIVAEAFLADPASVVDASSQEGGIDGEVNIEAVKTNLSEIVTPLSPRFAQTAALLSDPCASRLQQGIVSSFVARGRASVPATPDGLLPSRLYSRAIDPTESESAGPREVLALNPHVRLSRRPCP
jgi:large exoprotein involved in heme utilization and adhesion